MKIKNIWNHHLVSIWTSIPCDARSIIRFLGSGIPINLYLPLVSWGQCRKVYPVPFTRWLEQPCGASWIITGSCLANQPFIPPGKDRWRSPLPLVLVYHGPLQIATELGSGVASPLLSLRCRLDLPRKRLWFYMAMLHETGVYRVPMDCQSLGHTALRSVKSPRGCQGQVKFYRDLLLEI